MCEKKIHLMKTSRSWRGTCSKTAEREVRQEVQPRRVELKTKRERKTHSSKLRS